MRELTPPPRTVSTISVSWPKFALSMMFDRVRKFAWLKALNNSIRISMLKVSLTDGTVVRLMMLKSWLTNPGASKPKNGRFPS